MVCFRVAFVLWMSLGLSFSLAGPLVAADGDVAAAAEKEKVEEYYELLRMFVDTLDQVERNYVQDLNRRELLEAAIEGMLSKLDQHSDYIDPEHIDQFKTEVESEFAGVGLQVTKNAAGQIGIISPIVGGPAHDAGLIAGDVITHIVGEPTEEMTLSDAVGLLKGKVGTTVKVTIRHPGGDREDYELLRDTIRVATVRGDKRGDDDRWTFQIDPSNKLGYIRITTFARHTTNELSRALIRLQDRGMQGLILDLRSNPGGLLSAAIEVSDMFLPEGRIVSTEGRNIESQVWEATKEGTYEDFPMVILVNRFSASASEIVAACLQDHGRAIVIGERTFGKGSVQNIIELEGGRSALKLTTASYQRPSGKNIHRFPDAGEDADWGVKPDKGFEIEHTFQELRTLIRRRQREDLLTTSQAGEDPAEETEDKALRRALDYLVKRLADGKDEAGSNGEDEDASAANEDDV